VDGSVLLAFDDLELCLTDDIEVDVLGWLISGAIVSVFVLVFVFVVVVFVLMVDEGRV